MTIFVTPHTTKTGMKPRFGHFPPPGSGHPRKGGIPGTQNYPEADLAHQLSNVSVKGVELHSRPELRATADTSPYKLCFFA